MDVEFTLMVAEPLPDGWDWSTHLLVWGTAPYPRSGTIMAKVGSQRVAGISVSPDGSGFTGFLKKPPGPNDRLRISLPGSPPIDTGLTITPPALPDA